MKARTNFLNILKKMLGMTCLFKNFQIHSIGFKWGEYEGKNEKSPLSLLSSKESSNPLEWCALALSKPRGFSPSFCTWQ